MATVVNSGEGGSSVGWAVAIIVLLVVIAGLVFWYVRGHGAAAPSGGGASLQVNLPAGGSDGSGAGGQ
jgi:hypothetical protein